LFLLVKLREPGRGTTTPGRWSVGWSAGSLPAMVKSRAFDDYPPVMDSADVAEMLGLPNIKTVQILVREGRIPARRLSGTRRYRFLRDRSSSGCDRTQQR
ncbi:MAG: helix-turn-helix domain-containing protein, partial [Acidimicrobiia bacterium]